jgi:hypothetical protein
VILLALLPGATGPDAHATVMTGAMPDVPARAGWAASPPHARLFAPPAHGERYRAFISRRPLDELLAGLAAVAPEPPPGAWDADTLPPLDAFGTSGTYDRFALVRLYTGRPVRVARGPRASPSGLETWTLISPYPDARLAALEPGTLLLVFDVPPL